MPKIYLSPSLQEFNPYVDGGNEEYYMNLIADEMIPYLNSSGIEYVRNTPSQTLTQAINESNASNVDFHLALHSNAAPPQLAGTLRGSDVYYYANSQNSRRAADIFVNNLKKIYPDPSSVRAVPTTSLAELTKTNVPAVLVEIAYHDNPEDAMWIRNNTNLIARNLVMSLTEYFGIPFIEPQIERYGIVTTTSGPLNLRSKPNTESEILTQIPQGANVKISGQWGDWYVVTYNGIEGYANSRYITV